MSISFNKLPIFIIIIGILHMISRFSLINIKRTKFQIYNSFLFIVMPYSLRTFTSYRLQRFIQIPIKLYYLFLSQFCQKLQFSRGTRSKILCIRRKLYFRVSPVYQVRQFIVGTVKLHISIYHKISNQQNCYDYCNYQDDLFH